MTDNKEKKFVINHVFKNVKRMTNGVWHYGKEERHFSALWKIAFYKNEDSFHLFIICKKKNASDEWTMDTTIHHVLQTVGGWDLIHNDSTFSNNSSWSTSLHQNEPLDMYVVDNTFEVECQVKIDRTTGSSEKPKAFAKPELSDLVLVIDDQKFEVNKAYLASHSPYFNALLLGNFDESKQSEVELKDIDPTEFQNFLEVLYGDPIKEESVEGVLELADMYGSRTVVKRCEEFFLYKSIQHLKFKFPAAVKYGLVDLQKKCILEMNSANEISSVLPVNVIQFDQNLWKELLKLSISLYNKKFREERISEIDWYVSIRKREEIGKKRNFDESIKKFSDVVLVVKGEKFYVSKLFLASHSTYFEVLLLGNIDESNQSEVELKDIEPYDFQIFLEILYGEAAIEDDTVDAILKLANKYNAKTAIERCEEFFIYKSEQGFKVKFTAAVKYGMDKLKKKCISKMNSANDISSVLPKDVTQFDHQMWKELLDHSIYLYNKN